MLGDNGKHDDQVEAEDAGLVADLYAHNASRRIPQKGVRIRQSLAGADLRREWWARRRPVGPEVSRLCLCDSLPARSVRSQFRRDRRCYTEGAPLH